MFAIPGILALVFFVYVRPQEVMTELQRVPLLYLFFAAALFGLAVDLKRRIHRFEPAPHTVFVGGFLIWSLITTGIFAPETIPSAGLLLFIPILLYALIAQSVRNFRSLELVAAMVFAVTVVLAVIGAHQGTADFGCAVIDERTNGIATGGRPDGRPCVTPMDCMLGEPEPGAEYICERVGLLDTTSVAQGRVRYRGLLGDPNELGLAVSCGLMLAFAFYARRPNALRFLLLVGGFVVVAMTVYFTRSRSAQLSLAAGLAVFAVHRWRWKAVIVGGLLMVPLIGVILGGSGRSDADASTETRLEAWRAGIEMFKRSPVFGVGYGQYTAHHLRTAHNSFILAVGETGLIGGFFWTMCVYLSFKIPIVALRRYARDPAARVAVIWSATVLAAMACLIVGSTFLSWTHHEMFWIQLGLAAGLHAAIRAHDPGFDVRVKGSEMIAVLAFVPVWAGLLHVYLKLKGF